MQDTTEKTAHYKVSVGIPVYKAETYIERCARSLLEQTIGSEDLELIFVDDASPDRSVEILENILSEYPGRKAHTKILRQSENKGPMEARRRALVEMQGKYFIFCDADDYAEKDMYETMFLAAEKYHADAVHCGYNICHVSGKIHLNANCIDSKDLTELKIAVHNSRLFPTLWCFMFRREIIDQTELFLPPFLRYSEDYLLLAQLLRRCKTAVSIPQGLYWYNRNDNSISHLNKQRNMRSARYCLRYLDKTDPDPVMLKARQSRWRALLHQDLHHGSLSRRQFHTILRKCSKGVLTDRKLSMKKRARLFLISILPPALNWFRKGKIKALY